MAGTAAAIMQDAAQTRTPYGTIIMLYQTQAAAHLQQHAQEQTHLIAIHKTYATTNAKEIYSHLSRR